MYATAFDSDDRLHAIVVNSAPNAGALPLLIQIDPTTGEIAFGQAVATLDYTGLAFDAHDNLFAVASRAGLIALDVATGETTILGGDLASAALTATRPSLAFGPAGELYAAADRLLLVDPGDRHYDGDWRQFLSARDNRGTGLRRPRNRILRL